MREICAGPNTLTSCVTIRSDIDAFARFGRFANSRPPCRLSVGTGSGERRGVRSDELIVSHPGRVRRRRTRHDYDRGVTDLRHALPPDLARHLPTAIGAAAAGALTLVDPARLRPTGRFALRSASAGIAGVGAWSAFDTAPELMAEPGRRVAFTAAVVGLVYGAAELGEVLDAATVRGLRRIGVRRPRVVMALATVGVGLATAVVDYRTARDAPPLDDAAGPVHREVTAGVRDLAAAILGHTEEYDSLRLRAQLAVASEEVWEDDDGIPSRVVGFSTPDDVPLAVPHTFTFPVSARFVSPRGVPCVVRLGVEGGRLGWLVIDVDDELWAPIADDWDAGGGDPDPLADVAWPAVDDVALVAERSGRP